MVQQHSLIATLYSDFEMMCNSLEYKVIFSFKVIGELIWTHCDHKCIVDEVSPKYDIKKDFLKR